MSRGSDHRSTALRANPLRTKREKLGSPEEVGAELELSGRTIYRYESGERPAPRWYRLALLGLMVEKKLA
jgi:hypothetical protein